MTIKVQKTKKPANKSARDMMVEKAFTLDGQFIKREAREAIRSYLMPFSGIYAAATGKKVILVRDRDSKWHEKKSDEAA